VNESDQFIARGRVVPSEALSSTQQRTGIWFTRWWAGQLLTRSTFKRSVESLRVPRPRPHDLRNARALSRYSDKLLMLYRPAYYDELAPEPVLAEIAWVHRGCSARCEVDFDAATGRFDEREASDSILWM